MRIIKDKEPIFDTENYDVILVGTSIYDMLVNGFQGKMACKYPHVEEENHKQSYGDTRRLGTRVTVKKKGCPIVSLMYICRYPRQDLKNLDYDALKQCLTTAALEFKGKRIMTTVLGATEFDGNGTKRRVLRMMEKAFDGMDVDVYDYKQRYRFEETNEKRRQFDAIGITERSKRTAILRQLYLLAPKNGEKQAKPETTD